MKVLRFHKHLNFIAALLATALNLSMYHNPHSNLLNADDLELERVDREDGPELSAPLNANPRWESFNEWQCFSTQDVQLECTELDSPEMRVPTIRVKSTMQFFDFSMDPEPDMDCEYVIEKWKMLLETEDSFCTYAAYLQDIPSDHFVDEGVDSWTLWIVEQVKTTKGYWSDEDISAEEEEDEKEGCRGEYGQPLYLR